MELFIKEKKAERGMRVTTVYGENGILEDWSMPGKSNVSGLVYVDFGKRKQLLSVENIYGKFVQNLNELYEEIGKKFEDFDFLNLSTPPPDGWELKMTGEKDIEYMEITFPEYEELPDKFEDVETFVYVRKTQETTNFIFTRKK